MEILGETTRKVEHLNSFLKSKGCPEYATFYSKAGKKYGVKWDMCVFQSCLETGFWNFGGDVKVTQNNFAGIGASGNGAKGDSFVSPEIGIEAQVQNMALRAGKFIPIADILAPYVAKNYELIAKRNTKTWESLSGTYAADLRYHEKVFAIMKEFDLFVLGLPKEDKKATWINITSASGLAVQAMAGTESIETVEGNSVEKLVTFLEEYMETCKTFAVGGRFPDAPEEPKPEEPKPDEPRPTKPVMLVPFAKQYRCNTPTKGKYRKGFPEGLIVHFTAGRGTAEDMLSFCARSGYTVSFGIDKQGRLYQTTELDVWGNHCGTFHHETHVGVEIINAGRLTKKADGTYWSWFGTQIPAENVRYMADTKEQIAGYYEKYTPEQEAMLAKVCLWLRDNSTGIFSLDNVIGHDEACSRTPRGRGAKNDPSGALSMSMPEFREMLKKKIASHNSEAVVIGN